MSTGRTLQKYFRVYMDGYDLSGFGRSVGPFGIVHNEADMTAVMSDTVKGYLTTQSEVNIGEFNGLFDNTATTGLHALAVAPAPRVVTVAMGIRAAPANGDPCFAGKFLQKGYQAVDDGGALTVNMPFSGWDSASGALGYGQGFGQLLHASAAETGASTSTGFDNLQSVATTTKGGYMVYQVLASSNASHTATLKVQEADTNLNASFADLTGATTGSITVTAGVSGIVALSPTATIKQYLRWQIALGTATSVTFVLAFVRG